MEYVRKSGHGDEGLSDGSKPLNYQIGLAGLFACRFKLLAEAGRRFKRRTTW
jgi:hypothetical protein